MTPRPHGAGDPVADAVVFVGPRGAGKTTLARELARRLGREWADTDALLAAGAGTTAGELLARVGAPEFRRREEVVVASALDAARSGELGVIALGGGAVLSAKTRQALKRPGLFIVFALAPPTVLLERIRTAGAPDRPPLTSLSPEEEVERILTERIPLYRDVCELELDTFSANVPACVRSILASMGHPGG